VSLGDDFKRVDTEEIKADYQAGSINFVDAIYDLYKAGYTPHQAQRLVKKWIIEEHNNTREADGT